MRGGWLHAIRSASYCRPSGFLSGFLKGVQWVIYKRKNCFTVIRETWTISIEWSKKKKDLCIVQGIISIIFSCLRRSGYLSPAWGLFVYFSQQKSTMSHHSTNIQKRKQTVFAKIAQKPGSMCACSKTGLGKSNSTLRFVGAIINICTAHTCILTLETRHEPFDDLI